MNFEDELRAALERREPPEGFAGRVVRAARPPSRRRVYRAAGWAAAAALLAGAGLAYESVREARRAREQALLALRIAGRQLVAAQKKLERLNLPRGAPERVVDQ